MGRNDLPAQESLLNSQFSETATVQRPALVNGVPTLVSYEMTTYNHPATMLKDVRFELAQDSIGSGIEPSGGGTTPDSGGDDEPRP